MGFLQGDERQQSGVKEEVELQEPEGTLVNIGSFYEDKER